MAYEQQIAKLKGHASAFVEDLEWVIQCFELVQPAIKDRELISKFTGNKRMLGFRILRRSVGRDCIIGITRVTYDHRPKNPTAGRLIAALTCPGADYLREKLKGDFARPIVPGEAPGRPRSELSRAASEEINKMEIAQGRQNFDEHISKLKEQWTWFSEHKGKFEAMNDPAMQKHWDRSEKNNQYWNSWWNTDVAGEWKAMWQGLGDGFNNIKKALPSDEAWNALKSGTVESAAGLSKIVSSSSSAAAGLDALRDKLYAIQIPGVSGPRPMGQGDRPHALGGLFTRRHHAVIAESRSGRW